MVKEQCHLDQITNQIKCRLLNVERVVCVKEIKRRRKKFREKISLGRQLFFFPDNASS